VEFFLPEAEWRTLLPKLAENPEVTWFAGNSSGQFEACHVDAVNPVTWGTFAGKEYVSSSLTCKK
jgi:methylenetetrahydrofolate reductase (NADPH)